MLVFDLFSVPSLLIPYIAANTAGRDGIFCIIIGTILAFIYGIVIVWFSKQIQGDFIDYSVRNVGRILSFLFFLLYVIKLFASLILCIVFLGNIVHDTLLVDTSYKVIIGVLIIVCAYASFRGIEVRARVIEFFFYIVLVPIIVLLLLGINGIDVGNLTPMFTESGGNIMAGSYYVLLAYSAIELFMFVPGFICKPYDMKVKIHRSISFVGLLNVLIYVIVIGIIGVVGSTKNLWPTVTVMQMIKMPGGLIKRQDGIMLSLWILGAFTFISMIIFYLSFLTNKIIKRKDYQYFIIPFAVIAYFVASIKIDIKTLFHYYGLYMAYVGFPQSILIPAFIILIGTLRKKVKEEDVSANEK